MQYESVPMTQKNDPFAQQPGYCYSLLGLAPDIRVLERATRLAPNEVQWRMSLARCTARPNN